MTTAAELDLSSLDRDPRLFLYTSLTAGSSHIVTATSRMETILKANRIPFLAIDIATDEKCRRLWQRRGGAKKKLPGLVKEGYIIGDIDEIEELNEFGELKEAIGPVPASNAAVPPGAHTGINTAPPLSGNVPSGQTQASKAPQSSSEQAKPVALPGAVEMAAILKAKKANDAVAAAAAAAKPDPTPVSASIEQKAANLSLDDKTEIKEVESKSSPQERTADVTKDSTSLPEAKAVAEDAEKTKVSDVDAAGPENTPETSVKQSAGEPSLPASKIDSDGVEKAAEKGGEEPKAEPTSSAPKTDDDGGVKTQEQDAKEPSAAGKSVED